MLGTTRGLQNKSRANSCPSSWAELSLKEGRHQKGVQQQPHRQHIICTPKTSKRYHHLQLMAIIYKQIQSAESYCLPFLCTVSIHQSPTTLEAQVWQIQQSLSRRSNMSTIYQRRITERIRRLTSFSASANEFRKCARCHPTQYSLQISTALCKSPQQQNLNQLIQCASKMWWPQVQVKRKQIY